jgi:CBS domain-containing protein
MKRWICSDRHVNGDPHVLERALLERSRELILHAAEASDDDVALDGSFHANLGARLAGMELTKQVRVTTGVAHRDGDKVNLPVRWWAEPARSAFPRFAGTLGLEALDEHRAQVYLTGTYDVPLGAVGAAFDSTLLRNVAQSTADLLIRGVARALEDTAPEDSQSEPDHTGTPPLRVGDVMTSDPLVIEADMPLRTAAKLLFHEGVSGAPVVTAEGELIGVLSQHDLLAKEATPRQGVGPTADEEYRRRKARTAREACTMPARVAIPAAKLTDAAREMLDHGISRLVVVRDGRVTGIVTRHDVLSALIRDDTEIEQAVMRLLEDLDEPNVHVIVDHGEVALSGTASTRGQILLVTQRTAEVNGVISVDTEQLDWKEDDLIRTSRGPET